MIDTIKYRLSDNSSGTDFREQIPLYLDKVIESKSDDQIFFSGDLGNLKVRFSKNTLSVENSLCRWYLGDNLKTLTRKSIGLANEKLSDILHVNMQDAEVIRLDVGHNYPMKYKPKAYFDSLGQLPRYNRLEQPNGVCFRTENIELIFYDKIVEYKKKQGKLPEEYSDLNLLRYELKLKNNLKRTLKRPEVTVQNLSNVDFYNQINKLHYEMYSKVEKRKELNLNIGGMKGVKGLGNTGIVSLINLIGQNQLIKMINNNYIRGIISPREKRDMLDRVKLLANSESLFSESSLASELSNSINLFAKHLDF